MLLMPGMQMRMQTSVAGLNAIQIVSSWVDLPGITWDSQTAYNPSTANTWQQIVFSPAGGARLIKSITVTNTTASPYYVFVSVFSGFDSIVSGGLLNANSSMNYTDGGGWRKT